MSLRDLLLAERDHFAANAAQFRAAAIANQDAVGILDHVLPQLEHATEAQRQRLECLLANHGGAHAVVDGVRALIQEAATC